MRKKIFWSLLCACALGLLYYLFLRPFEFEVRFQVKTSPGDIIETIRIWNRSLDTASVFKVESFDRLQQNINWKKRNYVYDWHFKNLSDSLTSVDIRISEPQRSLINKILVPFTSQPIEQDAGEIGNVFYNILKEHLRITKVMITGETVIDSSFCVCSALDTHQIEKANGMMNDYLMLGSFITTHNLKSDGNPMVRISEWNHEAGTLKFNFCFPIQPVDSIPKNKLIEYKVFKGETVLKAEYRGNYITSDRAWYELLRYAEKNKYEVTGLPIERFYDNPNLGANELNWKADVYLPVKKYED